MKLSKNVKVMHEACNVYRKCGKFFGINALGHRAYSDYLYDEITEYGDTAPSWVTALLYWCNEDEIKRFCTESLDMNLPDVTDFEDCVAHAEEEDRSLEFWEYISDDIEAYNEACIKNGLTADTVTIPKNYE